MKAYDWSGWKVNLSTLAYNSLQCEYYDAGLYRLCPNLKIVTIFAGTSGGSLECSIFYGDDP